MIGRPVVRRRALRRAAVVGGTAYVVGKRRAEQEQAQEEMQRPQETAYQPEGYESAPAGQAPNRVERLTQLAQLRDSGALTEEEFEREKQKILAE